ncbi:hypothetical protein BDC45DRAFT_524373 [Circinella umbellata]|nr:hypothetical protein BDC45DRAFT_524373 [Circinella umbellata]
MTTTKTTLTTSISTPVRRSDTEHIGFTEFQLDPLDANHTSPLDKVESCRTFTFCLEPVSGTLLEHSLKRFQDVSYVNCGPNRAHDASLHISILGKIQITRGQQSHWRTADRLRQVIHQQVQLFNMTPPLFVGYQTVSKPTRALAMQVHVDAEYAKLARSIHRLMTPEQGVKFQNIPPMNRIYLAYDILKSIPSTTLSQLLGLAKQTIDINDWVLHGHGWQLSLYEVILESRVKGVKQQTVLLDSWELNKPEMNTPSPWLPKSLRVKLAVFSARCFGPPQSSISSSTQNSSSFVDNNNKDKNEQDVSIHS